MTAPLASRLDAARRRRFVGRSNELELFQSALTAPELPFYVLYIFGPGGLGKTTLLREFSHVATQAGITAVYLDGRNVEPSPDVFLGTLQQSLNVVPPTTLSQFLMQNNRRYVILVDTYEVLAPLDGWLRDSFLPQLPGNILMVLAGRNPPSLDWRTDPGWETIVHILPLRNLNPDESQDLLQSRQVPSDQYKTVLDFTHGHPLALSLVADVLAQHPGTIFHPEEAPHVIKTLLEQFVQKVPGPAHRAALEACGLVRLTTESLVGAMLNLPDAHELFEWLRQLSFIDAERHGIYPHDLAREALTADLRWRNPDWYAELHSRARNYYMQRLEQSDPHEQRRVLQEYIYLHRENPMVRPFLEWRESGTIFTDRMRSTDISALLHMVRTYEGEDAQQMAAYWLEHQPQSITVFRDSSDQAKGFSMMLNLNQTQPDERKQDKMVETAWNYLQRVAPIRPGEIATLLRFWMSQDSYQMVSPVQSRIFLSVVQHYLTTPNLAFSMFTCLNPDFWIDILTYADLQRLPELDYIVDGRSYGVYGHDWRITPSLAWLNLLAEREIASGIPAALPRLAEQVIVLSESDFATAVRDSLRDYINSAALANNLLLQSRLILQRAKDKNNDGRITALKHLLQETAEPLQQSPKQLKLYQALYYTYFKPAATQEKAAEILDLPFSTYRRHLRSGIEYMTERLWQLELGSLER
jgi:hypothetical protein